MSWKVLVECNPRVGRVIQVVGPQEEAEAEVEFGLWSRRARDDIIAMKTPDV